MDEKPRPWFGIRDALWLAALAMILAAWGWDRGRLATRLDTLSPATPRPDWRTVTPRGPIIVYDDPFDLMPMELTTPATQSIPKRLPALGNDRSATPRLP